MYEAHFGLKQRPFRSTPDRECYYPATSHEQALAPLRLALADGEGFSLMTGEPGMGKTLLCHRLLESEPAPTAFLTNSHFPSRAAMLQAILFDLSLPHELGSEQALRLALTEFLLKNLAQDRRTLLVIDEAHHLTPDLLEELRLLTNIESGRQKALQVLLAAQPQFEKCLTLPQLASFRQRLMVRCRLEPLGRHESADYLGHHLKLAGGWPDKIFTEEALDIIARATGGVPRLLNQAAHLSLVLAFQAGVSIADAEVAMEACAAMDLTVDEPPEEAELSVVAEALPAEACDPDMPPDEDDSPSGIFAHRPA
jgi:type II secretory pathway predicted ATPase ExeA